MPEKKTIVVIDDYRDLVEIVTFVLEEKGFEVKAFPSFLAALPFLEDHTPELIITDLIGHDNMNGIQFYINHIMKRKIKFAVWTGCLDLSNETGAKNFSLFLEGMPKDYRVSYDPDKALEQGEADLIIEDFKMKKTARLHVFSKFENFNDILKYFNLDQSVILYFGSLAEMLVK